MQEVNARITRTLYQESTLSQSQKECVAGMLCYRKVHNQQNPILVTLHFFCYCPPVNSISSLLFCTHTTALITSSFLPAQSHTSRTVASHTLKIFEVILLFVICTLTLPFMSLRTMTLTRHC